MCTRLRHRANPIPLLVLAVAIAASSVDAVTDPDDLCTGDPCIITNDVDLEGNGLVILDFGELEVILESVLDAGETSLAVFAQSFEIRDQGQLRGTGEIEIDVLDYIRLNGARTTGAVRMISDFATLQLTALGSVEALGNLFVRGDGPDSDGGTLGIEALGAVSLSGDIDLGSGNLSGGGLMGVASGEDTTISGSVDLSGGEDGGGIFSIRSGGSAMFGGINVDGSGEFSDGGDIEVDAADDIVITHRVRGRGADEGEDCGESGAIQLVSGGSISIEGDLDFDARSGDCCGGFFDAFANSLTLSAEMQFNGSGPEGCGGILDFEFEELFACESTGGMDVSADGNDGDISFRSSFGDLSTADGCVIMAAGVDGDIAVRGAREVRVDGLWQAGSNASLARGSAGVGIEIEACEVVIGATGTLASLGATGQNVITANDAITIQGALTAGDANRLVSAPGVVPVITGSVDPEAILTENETLTPCAGAATPTPVVTEVATSTQTGVPTFTPTEPLPTSTPPAIPTFTSTPPQLPTSTADATSTMTPTDPPTETPMPCSQCTCDCNGDCRVAVNELVVAVQISLGSVSVDQCLAADRDNDGLVRISELIAGVNALLNGCVQAGI